MTDHPPNPSASDYEGAGGPYTTANTFIMTQSYSVNELETGTDGLRIQCPNCGKPGPLQYEKCAHCAIEWDVEITISTN